MEKNERFKIISEGLQNGVSETCRKYDISRTLYYRWLKRFKTQGIDGLEDQKKSFLHPNRTAEVIEDKIFELIKTYPTYGPQALKYLLDELGYAVSESAVYNVLKRHNLSTRASRLHFSKFKDKDIRETLPPISHIKSGESWIFWITDYGNYDHIGRVYVYNFFDLKSKIACARIYSKVSFNNFEDLLTATALSIARSLNMKIDHICLFEDRKILKSLESISRSKIHKTLLNHGFESRVHFLDHYNDQIEVDALRATYMEESSAFLMPLMNSIYSFDALKIELQHFIKKYNLHSERNYDQEWYTPMAYHNKLTHTKLILPIWAYMDRKY